MATFLQATTGLLVFCGLAWLFSDRRRVPVREVIAGLGLQFLFAALLLHLPTEPSAPPPNACDNAYEVCHPLM